MLERRGFCLTICGVVIAWPHPVAAGSYLDRASVLVHQASSDARYLRQKLYDRELARLLHKIAAARLEAAGSALVPKEVVQAHPHLLLMLEHYERATNAAKERKPKAFLKHLRQARSEEHLFRGILKQLGWELPPYRD